MSVEAPPTSGSGAINASVPSTGGADHSALSLTLRPLRPFLDDEELTELCINRPGEAYIERASGWERVPLPCASFEWCLRLAKLIANATQQKVDA
jgi:type IV secretion system protein VirB11